MKYLLVFTILIFSGCSDYEFRKKDNKLVDDFVNMMSEVGDRVEKLESVNVPKDNTELLLDIKRTVEEIANAKNINGKNVNGKTNLVNSCDCDNGGVCNCENCECINCSCENCEKCKDGVCPINTNITEIKSEQKQITETAESIFKDEVKPIKTETGHIWGTIPSDYYVIKYGESWCRGCNTWDAVEEPQILQGCKVKHRKLSDWPEENISVIPDCKLFVWNGVEWEFIQTFPSTASSIPRAADINAKIKAEIKKRSNNTLSELRQYGESITPKVSSQTYKLYPNTTTQFQSGWNVPHKYESRNNVQNVKFSGRLSGQSLRNWIKTNGYNRRNCMRHAEVRPRSSVWSHLVNEHGFNYDQIRNLQEWEALAIHSAAHIGQLTPFG